MIKYLSAKNAAALDKDLMSVGAFSIDQLMELAGLSVSQAGTVSPFGLYVLKLLTRVRSLSCSPAKSRTQDPHCLRAWEQW
jgi:hypothetical protein